MSAADWATALGARFDETGAPTAPDIAAHIRAALRISGSLRRAQISRGLGEAYAPFGITADVLRATADRALQSLVLIGDVTELTTAGGAAYLLTPPKLVTLGPDHAVLLGASDIEPGSDRIARRLSRAEWPSAEEAIRVDLEIELGLPDWRGGLVEIGGADAPRGTAAALFDHAARLSAGGDRLQDLDPSRVRILSGRQDYFGRYDGAQPEGRWRAASADGSFCAVRRVGYGWRPCVVTLGAGDATVWDTADWDVWRWAIVGQTLSAADAVCRYDPAGAEFTTLVPMPRQLSRLMALAADPTGPWRWRCDSAGATAAFRRLTGDAY